MRENFTSQEEFIALINKRLGDSRRCALIETYGCQQNVNDSQKIAGMLCAMGYEMTDSREEADVIIFNTCAVRDHAEQRVFGNLGALKHLKEKKPRLLIGICGCMPQQQRVADAVRAKYRHVDMIFGTSALDRFPEIFSSALDRRETVCDIELDDTVTEGVPTRHDGGAKAFVSIMYGCNNFCTYCIVPYVRGRERSREKAAILSECEELVSSGVKEIMLLGQNVNSYGKDIGENFASLLDDVAKIDGLSRIRFMSSHPKDLSPEVLRVMARHDNICNQLHLPLQSGSDRVLKLMNRNYDTKKYFEIIDAARELMPDIAISTDVIVGFPDESGDDFAKTLDALNRVRYESIFSFIYSVRPGTVAAKMENQIDDEVKSRRFDELVKLQNEISLELNERRVGGVYDVLVEGESKEKGVLFGRDYMNKIVNFKGDASLIGRIVPVKITKAQTWILLGELS